jgi:hypothetical protein
MDISVLSTLDEKFDFALEWSVLHHIMPPDRERHIRNVSGILNNGAKYFASCFSERGIDVTSPEDKYRISPLGTRLYYSSQEELQGI